MAAPTEGVGGMITYEPRAAVEGAVLESGRVELAVDTAGREVICAGPRLLPKVVLPAGADLQDLLECLAAGGARAFSVVGTDPWRLEPARDEQAGDPSPLTAAEEYLVMGLRPMRLDGRPLRVAWGRGVVRLYLLPWTLPARTLNFGHGPRFVVTSTRSVVGDWLGVPDARRGVVVGLPEAWVGILERRAGPGATLAFRCDVPVPWVGEHGLANAVPTAAGAYVLGAAPGTGDAWAATLPVPMTEGNVVSPVLVPDGIEVDPVADGPWEREAGGSLPGSSDFPMEVLTSR